MPIASASVDRIAQHRENRGEHRQREFPLEEGEEAEDDDDVVQVRDNGRDREAPFEPQREIRDDAERHEQERERAVFVELLADLRAHELDALLRRRRIFGLERRHDALGQLRARQALLERKPNQRRVRAAEALRRILAEPQLVERVADMVVVDGVRILDFDHRPAAEVDAEIESPRREKDDGGEERDRRDHVEHERMPHERDVAREAEEFHGQPFAATAVRLGRHTWPIEILSSFLRLP